MVRLKMRTRLLAHRNHPQLHNGVKVRELNNLHFFQVHRKPVLFIDAA